MRSLSEKLPMVESAPPLEKVLAVSNPPMEMTRGPGYSAAGAFCPMSDGK